MHNSKWKLLLRAACFCLTLVLILSLCNFALYDDSTYTRLILHEMYESEPIDLAFISGSITYKAFVPEIWDETLGVHSFNFGSSAQTPDGSYYLLKEVFRHHSPKYVIFATNYISFMDMEGYNNPQRHYILFDHMKPSANKAEFWLNAFDEHTSLTALLPFMRNKDYSPARISSILETKLSDTYRNYGYDIYMKTDEEYRGRGYVYRFEAKETGGVGKLEPVWFHPENVDQTAVEYFGKLAKLCKENGAELILMPTPVPYGSMALQEDYQEVSDFYTSLAESNGIELFDFSLAKPELFATQDGYFYDHVHLNGPGSEHFSKAASQLVKDYLDGKAINREALFYGNFQELLCDNPRIFNTWLDYAGDAYYANSTHGAGVEPEYRFLALVDGTWTCIQEYGDHPLNLAQIPETATQIRVEARPQGSTEEYQQFGIAETNR